MSVTSARTEAGTDVPAAPDPPGVSGGAGATGPGLVLAVGLFLVLAVVLPMISVVWQDDTATTLNVVLALVVTTWSAAMIAAICFRGGGAIVRPSRVAMASIRESASSASS